MTAKKPKSYGNESISTLKGADRVRKRPGVIFGSDGLEGCEHSMFEILSNSIDEAREGHGEKIIITRYRDHSIEVEDFARGIPVDYNENEQRYNWELVFCELYAGGKFQNQSAESYEFSLGLNGLGLCATQYASEFMDVVIHRDNLKYTLHFEHGENVGGLQKEECRRRQTGSKIRWRPDLQVFTEIDVPAEHFLDVIKRQAVVNQGLLFVFKNETAEGFETTELFYENGISDYVKELSGAEETLTPVQYFEAKRQGRDREDKDEYRVRLSVAFCFSNRQKALEYYHNSSFLEHGGSPERAVKQAFVNQLDSLLRNGNRYLKGESKITFPDIEDCLVLVSSSFSTQTSYENQTKKAITNKFIYEAMTEFLKHNLLVYFTENPDDAARVAEQVLINKRSRENAEKTRLNLKKKLAGSIDLSNRVQKFVDCRSKDTALREIFIVEGDSALGACKQGRDAAFQAIIPVRGKILNCLKSGVDRIFKTEIITDIFKVLGCGVELRSKANKELSSFDITGLRWNKIIICTDADVDGFHIRTMILTMLYTLAPTLIEEGYVYIAESPLYEIGVKDKVYFAYSEQEKADALREIGTQKHTIQRSKGLGENEPDMMWLTTMNPKTRRTIRVTAEDMVKAAEMFELLLGDNLDGRKEFIAQNGALYIDAADVS